MKTQSLSLFKVSFLFLLITLATTGQAQTAGRIRVIFGSRSHPASGGDGCEGDKGICLIVNLHASRTGIPNLGAAELSLEKGKLRFNITEDGSPAERSESYLNLFTDKVMDPETCRLLGYDQMILKAGRYTLDKTKNPLGSALINFQGY